MSWDDIAPYVVDLPIMLILFMLVLFVVIFIHEMGHFLAARLFGMKVGAVVIGRGRTLKSLKDKHGTRWDFRLVPFGAHVDLVNADGENSTKTFDQSPYWQRMVTILGGPFINLLTPLILFPAFYIIIGQPSGPPVVAGVEIGLVADRAGIQPGDRFLAIDDIPFSNAQDIWEIAYPRGPVESRYTLQRGEEVIDIALKPGWEAYKDDGIDRANARFGIVWEHRPLTLKYILSVNGTAINKNEELARKLIIKNLGKETRVGLKGADGKEKSVKFVLSKETNEHLFDEGSDEYEVFYLGNYKGNFYLKQPFLESVKDGTIRAIEMIKGVATLPFQLLPFDPRVIRLPYPVGNPDTALINRLSHFVHGICFISVFLGLLNLLPCPGLDGGYLFIQTIERVKRNALTLKQKATLYVSAFLLIYLSVLYANMDNLPYYIDSRLEKLHEFMSGEN